MAKLGHGRKPCAQKLSCKKENVAESAREASAEGNARGRRAQEEYLNINRRS